jgi:AcrR family transcriptional regulator
MNRRTNGAPPKRRDIILDAAMELMSRYGYRRTSIDDIARRAEIAKGTVYLSFAGKEEIFRALCERVAARCLSDARRAVQFEAPIDERIAAMLEAKYGLYFDIVSNSPHAAELIDSKNRLSGDLFDKTERSFAAILRTVIADASRVGEFALTTSGLGASEATELLMASASGIEKNSKTRAIFSRRIAALARITAGAMSRRAHASA